MHEYATARLLVETVLREVERRSAKSVTEVHLVIGNLTFLSIEQLQNSYSLIAKGTPAEGSHLIVTEKEGVVECSGCGYRGPLSTFNGASFLFIVPSLCCPQCGDAAKIVAGRDCLLTKIRMEV
ncbi:MAG: hydrogenase maturation nickel metallochaperone HypA [Thaumarchaeota archaeon]|nr:hydrogenase maturation nickel metallochaperone HypA [Nitrososphaerota archaeon]MCL5318463.1 hydrogenase maturation nickel metallochaperone HypA [Nitrososphaerota archaeon]